MAVLPSGIGTSDQATQVTAFIRQQPWYLDWLRQNNLTPGPDQQVRLTDQQRKNLANLSVQHGIGLNNKYDQFDENGQVSEAHHKLKKTLIGAAIGGAALTGFGAAGIGPLAGAFGGGIGGGAAGGATAAEVAAGGAAPLASTTIGTGMIPGIAGGTGLAGGAAGGSTGILSAIGSGAKAYASNPSNWLDLASQLTSNAAGRAQGREAEAGINQAGDRNKIALYQAMLANNQAENNFGLNRGQLDLSRATAANNFGLSRGQLANQNASTDLAQRQFALQAPQMRGRTAVQGDILANAQDATVSGISPNIPVPTINGGLRPSMFSNDTRALGRALSSGALAGQQKGDTFAPLPDLPTYQGPESGLPNWQAAPAAPTLSATPEANGLDTALTTGGNLLNLGGTFADFLRRYRPKTKLGSDVGTTDTGDYTNAANF